jgi:hypothetical protein
MQNTLPFDKEVLKNTFSFLQTKKIPQRILIYGPYYIGKLLVVRNIAIQICSLCKNCGSCEICSSLMEKNESMYHIVLHPDEPTLTIDMFRKLKEKLMKTMVVDKYIVIIPDFHRATLSAYNSFLKTLEEVPENIIFIMTTSNIALIPDTIQSRVQLYSLALPKKEVLQKYFNKECFDNIYIVSLGRWRLMQYFSENETILQTVITLNKDIEAYILKNDIAAGMRIWEIYHNDNIMILDMKMSSYIYFLLLITLQNLLLEAKISYKSYQYFSEKILAIYAHYKQNVYKPLLFHKFLTL